MADWTTPDAIHSKCGEEPTWPATNTIDDNLDTMWRHYKAEYHWIIFDMGETKKITKIRLYLPPDKFLLFGKDWGFYVYVGDNPADLGDAVWDGTLTGDGWQESGAFDKNGRYIKLESKSDAKDQRIYEFDAYAEAVAPPPPPVEENPLISKPLASPIKVSKPIIR